jgi:hypothetical protein
MGCRIFDSYLDIMKATELTEPLEPASFTRAADAEISPPADQLILLAIVAG